MLGRRVRARGAGFDLYIYSSMPPSCLVIQGQLRSLAQVPNQLSLRPSSPARLGGYRIYSSLGGAGQVSPRLSREVVWVLVFLLLAVILRLFSCRP